MPLYNMKRRVLNPDGSSSFTTGEEEIPSYKFGTNVNAPTYSVQKSGLSGETVLNSTLSCIVFGALFIVYLRLKRIKLIRLHDNINIEYNANKDIHKKRIKPIMFGLLKKFETKLRKGTYRNVLQFLLRDSVLRLNSNIKFSILEKIVSDTLDDVYDDFSESIRDSALNDRNRIFVNLHTILKILADDNKLAKHEDMSAICYFTLYKLFHLLDDIRNTFSNGVHSSSNSFHSGLSEFELSVLTNIDTFLTSDKKEKYIKELSKLFQVINKKTCHTGLYCDVAIIIQEMLILNPENKTNEEIKQFLNTNRKVLNMKDHNGVAIENNKAYGNAYYWVLNEERNFRFRYDFDNKLMSIDGYEIYLGTHLVISFGKYKRFRYTLNRGLHSITKDCESLCEILYESMDAMGYNAEQQID